MSFLRRLLVPIGLAAARRPKTVLVVCAAVLMLSIAGTLRLHPTGSIDSMLAREGAAPQALARVMQGFGVMDELILLVTAPPSAVADSATAAERLRAFGRRLASDVLSSDRLARMCRDVAYREPQELRQFIQEHHIPAALLYVDHQALAEVRERLSSERIRRQVQRNAELIAAPGMAAGAIAKSILRDPLRLHETLTEQLSRRFPATNPSTGEKLLLSRDGRTLMVRLSGKEPASDLDVAREFTAAVRELVREIKPEGWTIECTGAYAIATMSERSIRRDMIVSITASVFLLMLLFLLVYGRAIAFVVAVAPVGLGIVAAFGISSAYSTAVTPVVAVIGALLAGLAIDYCVHFLSHFSRGHAAGLRSETALRRSLEDVAPAMAAACLTSIIGFAAIAQSSVGALRHFAVLGVLGLGCAMLAAVTALPAVLALLSERGGVMSEPRMLRAGLVPLVHHMERQPRRVASAAILLMAASGAVCWAVPDGPVRFDQDLTVLHPRPNPPLDAQHTLVERFGFDPDPLIVHLEESDPQELLKLAHRVDRALASETVRAAGVAGTFGPASLLPDPATLEARTGVLSSFDSDRIVADFDAALADSIFDPAAYDGYREFLRAMFEPDPPGWEAIRRYSDLAGTMLPAGAIVSGRPATEAIALALLDRPLVERAQRNAAIDAVRNALEDVEGATLTGVSVVAHDTERLIRRDLARLLWVAALLVIAWLVVFLQGPAAAALAILPVLFGLAMLFGVMAAADLRFNMVNLIALPILVGIGVDDGLFLVSLTYASRDTRRGGQDLLDRIGTGCHAVLMTTLTTVLAFGTLTLTSTPAIQSLGLMLAVGMIACLLGTLFLLVPILLLTQRR